MSDLDLRSTSRRIKRRPALRPAYLCAKPFTQPPPTLADRHGSIRFAHLGCQSAALRPSLESFCYCSLTTEGTAVAHVRPTVAYPQGNSIDFVRRWVHLSKQVNICPGTALTLGITLHINFTIHHDFVSKRSFVASLVSGCSVVRTASATLLLGNHWDPVA